MPASLGFIFNNKIEKAKAVQIHSVRAKGFFLIIKLQRRTKEPKPDRSFPELSLETPEALFLLLGRKKKKGGGNCMPSELSPTGSLGAAAPNPLPPAQAEPPSSHTRIYSQLPAFLLLLFSDAFLTSRTASPGFMFFFNNQGYCFPSLVPRLWATKAQE